VPASCPRKKSAHPRGQVAGERHASNHAQREVTSAPARSRPRAAYRSRATGARCGCRVRRDNTDRTRESSRSSRRSGWRGGSCHGPILSKPAQPATAVAPPGRKPMRSRGTLATAEAISATSTAQLLFTLPLSDVISLDAFGGPLSDLSGNAAAVGPGVPRALLHPLGPRKRSDLRKGATCGIPGLHAASVDQDDDRRKRGLLCRRASNLRRRRHVSHPQRRPRYAVASMRCTRSFILGLFRPGLAEEVRDSVLRSTESLLATPRAAIATRSSSTSGCGNMTGRSHRPAPCPAGRRRGRGEDGWVEEQLHFLLGRMLRLERRQRRARELIPRPNPRLVVSSTGASGSA